MPTNAPMRLSPEERDLILKHRGEQAEADLDQIVSQTRSEMSRALAESNDRLMTDPTVTVHGPSSFGKAGPWVTLAGKRFVFASDNHGKLADAVALQCLYQFVADFKPHYRIAGGDWNDAAAIRSGATKEEKRESIREDKSAGQKFIEQFKPTHALEGNHDARLRDVHRQGNGPLSDYCGEILEEYDELFASLRTVVFPYSVREGVLRLGGLAFVHGFDGGGKNAVRRHAEVFGNVILGHGHAFDSASVEKHPRKAVGMMSGCLCQIEQRFNRARLSQLRQDQGFYFGEIFDDGTFAAFPAAIENGRVITPPGA